MENEQLNKARDLFLHTEATRQQIADILDVNRKTLYLWIKQGRWAEMKTAAGQAPGIMLQDIYNHISNINYAISSRKSQAPTLQEVEMLRKLVNTTKAVQQLSLSTYVEVFQELTTFIYKRDVELGKKVTLLADQYIKGMTAKKGFNTCEHVSEVDAALKEYAVMEAAENLFYAGVGEQNGVQNGAEKEG